MKKCEYCEEKIGLLTGRYTWIDKKNNRAMHDKCYEKCGVDASTRWTWRNILSPCALICDLKLLNGVNGCQGEICH